MQPEEQAVAAVGGGLSGRVGTRVFSRNRHGSYSYDWVPRTDPDTSAQRNVRSAFELASKYWPHELEARRKAWETYARNVPRPTPVSHSRTLSGFSAYMGAATLRNLIGHIGPVYAPEIFTLGLLHAPTLSIFLGLFLRVDFDPRDRWLYQNNGYVWLQQSPVLKKTVNYFTGPFHALAGRAGSPSAPPNPLILFPNPLPNSTFPRVFFRFRTIEADNRVSPPVILMLDFY